MYGLVRFVLLVTVAVAASAQQNTNVVFHLFTRTNPTQSQPLVASLASIMTSSFSITNPTFISIHTNGESVTGNFNAFFVPTHLQSGDVNVLAVDWSSLSQMYSQGVAEAPNCGAAIAQFMNLLINDLGYQAANVRLIGHGLGGHVAGIAARLINGNVPHVVALDPSLVGWTHNPHRLSPNAATVVEVLHTTAGHRGYDYPLGHIDFYPNGGSHQNGCGADVNCSHTLAYAFYAESVTASVVNANRFVGTRCTNYEEAITLRCAGSRDATFGGLESKTGITGIFMFLTNPSTPFARG